MSTQIVSARSAPGVATTISLSQILYSGPKTVLTTEFTPPPQCSTRWLNVHDMLGHSVLVSMPMDEDSIMGGRDYWSECQPYSATYSVYSPGVCPSGQSVGYLQKFIENGTVVYEGLCCPSSMTGSYDCLGSITTPTTVLTWYMLSNLTYLDFTETTNGDESTVINILKNTTVVSNVDARVRAIPVYFQISDLSAFPSSYASSLASRLGVSIPTSAASTTAASPASSPSLPTPTASPHVSHTTAPELSTRTKAGIGVGSAIGALVICAIITVIIWRRRKSKRQAVSDPHATFSEMSGHSKGWKGFLNGKWRAEAQGESFPVEIDSRGVRVIPGPPAELEGHT